MLKVLFPWKTKRYSNPDVIVWERCHAFGCRLYIIYKNGNSSWIGSTSFLCPHSYPDILLAHSRLPVLIKEFNEALIANGFYLL